MIRAKMYFKCFYGFLMSQTEGMWDKLWDKSICKPSTYKARYKQKQKLLYEQNFQFKRKHLFTRNIWS